MVVARAGTTVIAVAVAIAVVVLAEGAAVAGGDADCELPTPDPSDDISITLAKQGYVWVRNPRDIDSGTTRPRAVHNTYCYVSDRFKFVFHHILKNGGSTMSGHLRMGVGEVAPGHKPGEKWPDLVKLPLTSHDPSWLRKYSCYGATRDLRDYLHFSFVRDPLSRLRSIQAFAEFHRRRGGVFKKEVPSLATLASSPDPRREFSGSTHMSTDHALPQHVSIHGTSGYSVDFLADITHMTEALRDHVVPVLKARLSGSGIDTTPLDRFVEYFEKDDVKINVMKEKRDIDAAEEARVRCLLYKSPVYARDYELFYTAQERKRQNKQRSERPRDL